MFVLRKNHSTYRTTTRNKPKKVICRCLKIIQLSIRGTFESTKPENNLNQLLALKWSTSTGWCYSLKKCYYELHLSFFVDSREGRKVNKQRFMAFLFCEMEGMIVYEIAHKSACIIWYRRIIPLYLQELQDCLSRARCLQQTR